MSHSVCPESPKHGFHFDTHEHDVRRVRKIHPCYGGRRGRGSAFPGKHDPQCTLVIEPGDVACVTIAEMFVSDTYACVPCARSVGALRSIEEDNRGF